jgi:hypothetical protein
VKAANGRLHGELANVQTSSCRGEPEQQNVCGAPIEEFNLRSGTVEESNLQGALPRPDWNSRLSKWEIIRHRVHPIGFISLPR